MTSTTPSKAPLSEADFMRLVTDLAELYGWSWVHFRPAQTTKGWRTPVSGPLGKGWPDLVLLRVRDKDRGDRQLLFVELKRDDAKVSPEQEAVMDSLDMLNTNGAPSDAFWISSSGRFPVIGIFPRVGVYVWRPRDFDTIQEVLR